MGFPSPAQDYVEQRISLDKRIITRPAATYFMRAGSTHYREGILSGALLVVDASLTPVMVHFWFALTKVSSGLSGIAHTRSHTWKTWRTVNGRGCQIRMRYPTLRVRYLG
jgi:hypothetical protein